MKVKTHRKHDDRYELVIEDDDGNEHAFNYGIEPPEDVTRGDYEVQQAEEAKLLIESAQSVKKTSAGTKVSSEGKEL